MHIKRFVKGFTLIELMLVIAVMAALVTAGIAAYQQKMQNAKIEQAALQIQTWLQAGLAFRVNNDDQWPKQDQIEDLVPSYIKSYSNPWRYCTEDTVKECFDYEIVAGSNNFKVNMHIPNPSGSAFNAVQVATLIANRLPNASVSTAGGVTVSAEVPLPGLSSIFKDQVIIKNIQYVTNEQYYQQSQVIPDAKCDGGRQWKRFISLVDFGVNRGDVWTPTYYMWSVSSKETPLGKDATAISPEVFYTDMLHPREGVKSNKGRIMVIDACMPEKKELTDKALPNLDNFRY